MVGTKNGVIILCRDVEMCMNIVMAGWRLQQVPSSEVCMVLRVEAKMYCNLNYQSSVALPILGN
jgi:hypothetical protein